MAISMGNTVRVHVVLLAIIVSFTQVQAQQMWLTKTQLHLAGIAILLTILSMIIHAIDINFAQHTSISYEELIQNLNRCHRLSTDQTFFRDPSIRLVEFRHFQNFFRTQTRLAGLHREFRASRTWALDDNDRLNLEEMALRECLIKILWAQKNAIQVWNKICAPEFDLHLTEKGEWEQFSMYYEGWSDVCKELEALYERAVIWDPENLDNSTLQELMLGCFEKVHEMYTLGSNWESAHPPPMFPSLVSKLKENQIFKVFALVLYPNRYKYRCNDYFRKEEPTGMGMGGYEEYADPSLDMPLYIHMQDVLRGRFPDSMTTERWEKRVLLEEVGRKWGEGREMNVNEEIKLQEWQWRISEVKTT